VISDPSGAKNDLRSMQATSIPVGGEVAEWL